MPKRPPFFLHNEVIKTVNSHCHLGLTLTSNLKWSAHINNICIKANERLAILNKLSFKINRKGLEQLYFAYADLYWNMATLYLQTLLKTTYLN